MGVEDDSPLLLLLLLLLLLVTTVRIVEPLPTHFVVQAFTGAQYSPAEQSHCTTGAEQVDAGDSAVTVWVTTGRGGQLVAEHCKRPFTAASGKMFCEALLAVAFRWGARRVLALGRGRGVLLPVSRLWMKDSISLPSLVTAVVLRVSVVVPVDVIVRVAEKAVMVLELSVREAVLVGKGVLRCRTELM